jgi:5-amino-6-(5-phosphoribosylamino)uracil reductase
MAARDLVAALRERGLRRIVCEGGPSLAGQLLDSGLVDELCLSTSPVLGGVTLPLFGGETIASRRLSLGQLLADESSTLYARWSVLS